MNIKVRLPHASAQMIAQLEAKSLNYTQGRDLFRLIELGEDQYVGVFGDGGFAAYEWFIWSPKALLTSDAGYGEIEVALRDGLRIFLK